MRSWKLSRTVCGAISKELKSWNSALAVESSRTREVLPLEPREMQPASKRTGVIAIKAGMTQDWDCYGAMIPLTVLWLDSCQVLKIKRKEIDGVTSMELGCGHVKPKNAKQALKTLCERAGTSLKAKIVEFKVTEDALLPIGTTLTAAHFIAGQYLDITGITIGKGFQGVMKRWGFAGGNASHGASKSHRSAGSIGACQDPGKVWKGKKMAGHMGCKKRIVNSVWVFKVDAERNLIYVKGQVPGHKGNYVYLQDAHRKPRHPDLPFPTHIGKKLDFDLRFSDMSYKHIGPLPELFLARPERNPYHLYQSAT